MKDFMKFIKSTGIFLIGNVLSRMVSFFMLPLYTNFISPSDFGIYDLNLAYMTFISSVLFLDIWGGIMRFMFDYNKLEDKYQAVTAGGIIFAISSILYVFTLILFGYVIELEHILLLIILGLLTNLQNVVGYIARALHKNYIFAFGGIINTVVTACSNILFIAYLRFDYEYLYISSCIGLFVNIIIIAKAINFKDMIRLKYFNAKIFYQMIKFSAPLCVNSVAYWFLTSYNKVVIQRELSSYENGLYAVANKFSALINIFTQCFQMAWQELTFSKANISKEEQNKFYTIAINEYIQFLYLGLILMIPIINIFFPIFIGNSYSGAKSLIPFALVAALLSSVSSFCASICSTFKKNKYIFTTTLVGSICNIILINITIGSLGIQAANISLALGFLAVVVRRIGLLRKFITIKIYYGRYILLTILFLVVLYIYLNMNVFINAIIALLVVCIIICTYLNKVKPVIYKIIKK